MAGAISFLDPNNPQIRALMERNPNGVFATMVKNAWTKIGDVWNRNGTGAATDSFVSGSNNAGGLASPSPNASQSRNGIALGGLRGNSNFAMGGNTNYGVISNGNQRNAFPGGAPLGVGATGNNDGSFMSSQPVSFAAGGMMTAQGGAIRPGAGMQEQTQLGATDPAPQLNPQQIDQEADRFVQSHPQEAQKVQAIVAQAIQSGEMTANELNMAVQLAKTALANPASYPQIRQFAIQNGLGTEQDIPQQLDKGLLYVLIVAGKSASAVGPQGNALNGQGPAPTMESGVLPEYKDGGMTGDRPHLAKVHPREYVIPEDALIYHGKKHFDKLVEQARTPPDAN